MVKLHNATSYACRNRYGGETTPLSEHALANALDVSDFVFQSGQKVTVLASWHTARQCRLRRSPKPADVARLRRRLRRSRRRDAPDDYTSRISSVSTTSLGRSLVKPITARSIAKVNPFVVPVDAKTNPFVVPTAVAKAEPATPPASFEPETGLAAGAAGFRCQEQIRQSSARRSLQGVRDCAGTRRRTRPTRTISIST